jgi:outer membrane protein assembly factor BamB
LEQCGHDLHTTFTVENVSHLKLLWSSQLSATPTPQATQTLTAPVVVSGIKTPNGTKTLAFTISGDSTLFAIDVDNGKVLWQKSFINPNPPIREATWLCPASENATPVIDKDKGVIYFTTSDGNLRGASLADGSEELTPTPFVAPYSRNWSLNLIDGWVYTTAARGCGGDAANPIEVGNVAAANVHDPAHVTVSHVYTGYGRPDGPWGRSGPVFGPQGVYVMTADGRYDPASGFFGQSVVAVRPGGYGVADSFTPSNWKYMNAHDLDLGAGSSVVFPFHGMALIAAGAKEGIEYLLDANELGGIDHSTPLFTSPKLGNDPDMLEQYGLWGGPVTWQNANGDRFIYLPMMNVPSKDAPTFPHVNGDVSKGSIMAFRVVEKDTKKPVLEPAWMSGVVQTPDMPAVENGIVFAVGTGEQTISNHVPRIVDLNAQAKFRTTPVGHQILYAFDAETGKPLYTSENILTNWDHFSQPVISHGKIFIVSHDAHVYAFGLK